MSDREKRIHAFLEEHRVFQMEIKGAIDHQNRGFESPKLASEFRRRSCLAQDSQSVSPGGVLLRHRLSSFKMASSDD